MLCYMTSNSKYLEESTWNLQKQNKKYSARNWRTCDEALLCLYSHLYAVQLDSWTLLVQGLFKRLVAYIYMELYLPWCWDKKINLIVQHIGVWTKHLYPCKLDEEFWANETPRLYERCQYIFRFASMKWQMFKEDQTCSSACFSTVSYICKAYWKP